MKTTLCRTAYSYLRYSSPAQGDGHSVKRQTAAAAAIAKKYGARLDLDRRMCDRGLSAYTGAHLKAGALGAFLAEVLAGRIAEGSILIVENLDRLSRENPWDAIPVLCSLVNAGITVITLTPAEVKYDRDGDNLASLVLAVVECVRSHNESKTKSVNLAGAWGDKKQGARANPAAAITRTVPMWLEVLGGKVVAIPDRVETVRRMFQLAAGGAGLKFIAKQLDAEGRKPFGRSPRWGRSYIRNILRGRAVLGEYQPGRMESRGRGFKKKRVLEGDPIAGYYPAVVELGQWERAQVAIAGRYVSNVPQGGRVGKVPVLFRGMIRDAANDCPFLVINQNRGKPGMRRRGLMLTSSETNAGRVPMVSFPYPVFEVAILERLREVSAADVLGVESAGEAARIAAQLAAKETRLRVLEAELGGDGGNVRALVEAAKKVDQERQTLLRKLTEARVREANPRAEALAEMQTLADVAKDPESRLRLRALLRQVVASIDVLVVKRKAVRLAAVQVNFAGDGGRRRNYCIEYRPAGNGRAERRGVEDTTDRHVADLRRRGDVGKMRRALDAALDRIDAAAVALAAA